MCEADSNRADEVLAELLEQFLALYVPADSWETADEHISSNGINDLFNSAYPIPIEKIYDALREKGFKCVPLSGQASFVWLLTLKRK